MAEGPSPTRVGRRAGHLPWPVVVVAALVLAVNVVLMIAGSRTVGLSIDEPIHAERMQSYLDHGWYLRKAEMKDGAPNGTAYTYLYGPAAAVPEHLVAVMLGDDEPGSVSTTPEAYEARRLVINGFGVLGLLGVAGIVWLLFGSWRWALLASAFLSAIPMWTGHAMFNIKDIPVAAGYTLVTAGLVGILYASGRWRSAAAAGVVALGTLIAVGTRMGMWTAVALSLVAMAIGMFALRVRGAEVVRRMAVATAGVAVGGVALFLLYPKAFGSPVTLAIRSASGSADFPSLPATLFTAGFAHSEHPPWFYIPAWFGGQLPVVVLLLAVAGLGGGLVVVARSVLKPRARKAAYSLSIGLVLVQAMTLPLVAVISGSALYNGVRHLLFVLPAVAVLAALALRGMLHWSAKRHALWRPLLLTATCLGIVVPTVDAVRLFPYDYTYFNEVATLRPINGNWATDYESTSMKEINAVMAAQPASLTEYWATGGSWAGEPPPPGCTQAAAVVRPMHARDVLMMWAARCPYPFPPYPRSEGLAFTTNGNGIPFLDRYWTAPNVLGVSTRVTPAGVRMSVPPDLRNQELKLEFGAFHNPFVTAVPVPLSVSVNGQAVGQFTPSAKRDAYEMKIPEQVAASLGEGRLAIEFAPTDPRLSAALILMTLRVSPA